MRILKTVLIFCFLFLAFALPAHAQFNPVGSIGDFENAAESCKTNASGACVENLSLYQMTTVFPSTMTCALTGLAGCDTTSFQTRLKNFQKSPLGFGTQVLAYMYQKPAVTTGQYFAWIGERAHIVPAAYAQGLTYSRLMPIFPIWKTFRDISFMLLTVILMFAGVMIMFRQKINPQTVAKIENTLPNIVITMILIAFSLPIAAFIIDLMYVAIAAGILIIGSAVHDPNVTIAVRDFTTGGAGILFTKSLAPAFQAWKIALNATGLSNVIDTSSSTAQVGSWGAVSATALGISAGGSMAILPFIFPIILGIGAGAAAMNGADAPTIFMTALSPILVLVLVIILAALFFRLLFILLSAYIQLIISIVLGPIILLWNAMPGQNSFSSWWKGILGNCLTFVITAVMLYLGWAITSSLGTQAFWVPPLLIQGAGVPQIVSGLIGLGLLTLIPQFITMAKGALGAKPIFQVGPGMLTQPITGGVMQGVRTLSEFHMASPAIEKLKGFVGGKK
ncbi:MAG: hypothetical protein NUV65_00380 [Candidatus Roizmanbacteria bacterium]|nr:hypothetical protein [Candidatus Roizmanbacteria bacterium]